MSTSIPTTTLEKFTTFGDLLRFLRRRIGITQMELAIAVGYSDAQISRLEQNLRIPDIPTIEARFIPALDLEDEPQAIVRLLDLAANVRREDAPSLGLCPYKGLNYFDETDADLFVGREALTAKLTDYILHLTLNETSNKAKFLAIVGASGSGKSSLVRAGMIPALRWNKKSSDWLIHVLTPTARPLESLAMSLTSKGSSISETAAMIDDLQRESRSLHLFARRNIQSGNCSYLLLVVDQFEELFALCRSEEERAAFINNLLTAASEADGPTVLIITLRADFYVHCASYPPLREALAQHQEYIGAMEHDELQRAIEDPAQRGNWELEPGLVDLLLRDVGNEPGALPLLSHAMLETWQRRRGRTMTLSGYASSGGVRGAIAETAETVFNDQFTHEQQVIARRVFLRLTALGDEPATGDTRRRATFNELILKPEEAAATQAVIKTLADARLIITSEDSAEVAHEALIREWPTLRGWLEDNRESLRLHRHLTEAAQEWLNANRDADMLYRGVRLTQTREWSKAHEDELTALESEFLKAAIESNEREAAEREEQRQRELIAARKLAETEHERAKEHSQSANRLRIRNQLITTVGVIALILAVLAGLFSIQSNNNLDAARIANTQSAANAATAQAEASARATQQSIAQTNFTRADALRLAAEANKLLLQPASDADLTTLLGLRSLNTEYTPQGDAAVEGAMTLAFPLRVFTGHTDIINGAAFSPDGKYIVTGSKDKTVRLWDAKTGQEVRRFVGHTDEVEEVSFSPDGKVIASASFDGTVRLWNIQTGEAVHVLTSPIHDDRDVIFLPDGRYLITATWTPPAQLWDIQTGMMVRSFAVSGRKDSNIYGAALSPDGKYLLTGGKDSVIHVWKVQTGIELRQFLLPVAVRRLAFSKDGKYFLAGGGDNIIYLWDFNAGQILRTFVGHTNEIWSLMFSPDDKYILSASGDGTARLWNTQTGDQIRTLTTPGVDLAMGAVFSMDGKYIFTPSGKTGRLWDMESVLNTGLPQFISPNDPVNGIAYSPDGKYVATASSSHNVARLWDIQTKKETREFFGHTDYLTNLSFSPNGKYLLTGSGVVDDTARLWDIQTGKELRRFAGLNGNVTNVAFAPNGKYIATFGDKVFLWDPLTGKRVREFAAQVGGAGWASFSPDSRYLLTVWNDKARIWEVETGKQIQLIKQPEGEEVWCVAFSPDGKYALTGDINGLIRLWDVETGNELREYVGHAGLIESITFSHDGKYILSTSDDSTARLWDVATGMELRRFVGDIGSLSGGAFSPDDKYVLTGASDGIARMWFVDLQDEIQYLCSRLTRNFTDEERKAYNITDNTPTCPKP